ncbi:MAG: HD domain-containing protein [Erysipelotrichaceae bacterium]|nr:HD domain-containing protein [Erysipelotrichaceae bacterium]
MKKEENVLKFYVICNKLKNVIRTGWKDWHVERERLESVAEHIYSVQMLAIAMKSEYAYDVDIMKVVFMLAVHELEETKIGDLTQFQISKEEKKIIGHQAVTEILEGLLDGNQIKELILEFDERKTKEADFAYHCDKLECDLQSKLYDEEGCVDLNHQEGNKTLEDETVKELLNSGMSWSEMWLDFGQKKYHYDENFTAVSNYAMKNKIRKFSK